MRAGITVLKGRMTPEARRSLCALGLHLKLCQLKCFWMETAKNSTQTELTSKWEFGAQKAKSSSRDCVGVEARFGVQEPLRDGSSSSCLPSAWLSASDAAPHSHPR